MNPNPTTDDDLQKAIDDITNNTNNDPVFDDTIAIPEPVTASAPKPTSPAPRPAASFPEVGMPPAPKAPTFKPAPRPQAPKPAPVAPAPEPEPEEVEAEPAQGEFGDVRESILRDLAPMVSGLNIDAKKKFDIYKNIREELHDDSVIASAYEVSKDIEDDGERADALLYLYDSLK